MAQYIDKSALVAEIEKIRKALNLNLRHDQGVCDGLYAIQKYINTLKVKEVDLDREMQAFALLYLEPLKISDSNIGISITMAQLYRCAKHFFELGIRASQPTTSAYGIEEALKENGIDPDSKEADVYREAIYKIYDRLKAQKGE